MWNERYAQDGYAYGHEPNDYLVSVAKDMKGPVLCLGAGEGRNALWLAQQGLKVVAVDASHEGTAKTLALARIYGVRVDARTEDLADFDMGEDQWGLVTSIFCHLPQPLRADVHKRVAAALRPDGHFVLEAYTPRQLAHKTGGPPDVGMLYEPDEIRAELSDLVILQCAEIEREVLEGEYHTGLSAVLQVNARK